MAAKRIMKRVKIVRGKVSRKYNSLELRPEGLRSFADFIDRDRDRDRGEYRQGASSVEIHAGI